MIHARMTRFTPQLHDSATIFTIHATMKPLPDRGFKTLKFNLSKGSKSSTRISSKDPLSGISVGGQGKQYQPQKCSNIRIKFITKCSKSIGFNPLHLLTSIVFSLLHLSPLVCYSFAALLRPFLSDSLLVRRLV